MEETGLQKRIGGAFHGGEDIMLSKKYKRGGG